MRLAGRHFGEVPFLVNCAEHRKSDPENIISSLSGVPRNLFPVVRATMDAGLIDSLGKRRSLQGTKPHLAWSLQLCSYLDVMLNSLGEGGSQKTGRSLQLPC